MPPPRSSILHLNPELIPNIRYRSHTGIFITANTLAVGRCVGNKGDEKYDAASGAMIAQLKYGSGLPFNRLDQLQASPGVSLPYSTQWEIVESVADKIHPAYPELMRQASQGDVVYNDDTVMKVLEQMKQSDEQRNGRKGMYTSGILSTVDNRKMAVFVTGSHHEDEKLVDILKKRSTALPPPIQTCDAPALQLIDST